MRRLVTILATAILSLLCYTKICAEAAGQPRCFYIIKIHKQIDGASARLLRDGFKGARQAGADYCIIDLNTYGGAVDAADSMRTAIMHSPIPTIAFINNQAASAQIFV